MACDMKQRIIRKSEDVPDHKRAMAKLAAMVTQSMWLPAWVFTNAQGCNHADAERAERVWQRKNCTDKDNNIRLIVHDKYLFSHFLPHSYNY